MAKKRERDTSKQVAALREKRAERRANGLCVYCGVPVPPVAPSSGKRRRGRPTTDYACDACKDKARMRR